MGCTLRMAWQPDSGLSWEPCILQEGGEASRTFETVEEAVVCRPGEGEDRGCPQSTASGIQLWQKIWTLMDHVNFTRPSEGLWKPLPPPSPPWAQSFC